MITSGGSLQAPGGCDVDNSTDAEDAGKRVKCSGRIEKDPTCMCVMKREGGEGVLVPL